MDVDGKIGVFQGTRNNLNDRDDKVTVCAYNKNTLGNPNGKIECEQKSAKKCNWKKAFFRLKSRKISFFRESVKFGIMA